MHAYRNLFCQAILTENYGKRYCSGYIITNPGWKGIFHMPSCFAHQLLFIRCNTNHTNPITSFNFPYVMCLALLLWYVVAFVIISLGVNGKCITQNKSNMMYMFDNVEHGKNCRHDAYFRCQFKICLIRLA